MDGVRLYRLAGLRTGVGSSRSSRPELITSSGAWSRRRRGVVVADRGLCFFLIASVFHGRVRGILVDVLVQSPVWAFVASVRLVILPGKGLFDGAGRYIALDSHRLCDL